MAMCYLMGHNVKQKTRIRLNGNQACATFVFGYNFHSSEAGGIPLESPSAGQGRLVEGEGPSSGIM